jgi:alpha/beta superfamily hydrolase
MEAKKISLKTADGIKLVGIQLKPVFKTDKIIILCHGLTVDKDEGGIFVRLAEILANKGIASFRFDFRGHGESGGRQEEMTIAGELVDLETVYHWLRKQGFKKIGLLGASFAGGITSLFCGFNRNLIDTLVLWNPAIKYNLIPKTPWEKRYFNPSSYTYALKYGFIRIGTGGFKLGIKVFQEIKYLKPYEELKKIKKPILFIHGDKDSYVDYRVSVKYAKLLQAKLVIIKGAEHGFHDKKEWEEKAIKETVNFLRTTL